MKKSGLHLEMKLTGCLLAGCLALAAGAACAEESEKDGWKLLFHDDFNRKELGEDWQVVNGEWEIVDGALRGSGTLLTSKGIPADYPPGFQRIEYKAVTDVQPIIFFPDRPKPKVSVGDMGCIIHAQPSEAGAPTRTGYFFQFGGFHNTRNNLSRAGTNLITDEDEANMIEVDKVHTIVAENDQGKLRFMVDGKLIYEVDEPQSILGPDYDRVGFYFYTAAKVMDVKVYVKRLADDFDLD
ncbi:MAG: hypothetical protein ABR497_06935 [Kiritimatiellia bacterium]|nr:hypothetical protein [Lentisphaerota bacterium]